MRGLALFGCLVACGPSESPVTIELTWDTSDANVDLYLLASDEVEPRGDPGEQLVGSCNKVGRWGLYAVAWPEFHREKGSELITIEAPRPGAYPIVVHRYRQSGPDPVATVSVITALGEIYGDERQLPPSTLWTVGLLHVPQMEVQVVDTVQEMASPCNR